MGNALPFLTESQFRDRLLEVSPGCPEGTAELLYLHFLELRRWNRRLSLVGPGTAGEVVERHYGESLAALPLLGKADESLLDIGTGAGFPGFVLGAAMPSLRVTLAESQGRKWAFLQSVTRRCGLSMKCLNVRVDRPLSEELPGEIDVVTCRALSLSPELIATLSESFPRVRFLFWCGSRLPELPHECRVTREIALTGSHQRRILECQVRRS